MVELEEGGIHSLVKQNFQLQLGFTSFHVNYAFSPF